jgi:hypothetical protein
MYKNNIDLINFVIPLNTQQTTTDKYIYDFVHFNQFGFIFRY